jgi:hypothetical protein
MHPNFELSISGFTALMLAAFYAGSHSTDETLRLLILHPAAPQVALHVDEYNRKALALAVSGHRPDHMPVDASHQSSDAAAMMLLNHESTPNVIHIEDIWQDNLLLTAGQAIAEALKAGYGFSRTYTRVYEMVSPQGVVKDDSIRGGCVIHYLCERERALSLRVAQQARLDERATLRDALKEGISLPGSTALIYI